jgi:hypothetical protein
MIKYQHQDTQQYYHAAYNAGKPERHQPFNIVIEAGINKYTGKWNGQKE